VRRDGITDLAPQRAREDSSGAEVFRVDRETVGYQRDGRRWLLPAESSRGAMAVWLTTDPRWDDGTPVTSDEAREALDTVRRVAAHWSSTLDVIGLDGAVT
jgi:hypothetical protein